MKIPRTKFQAISYSQKTQEGNYTMVYLLGGKKFDGHRTNAIEVFDPWSGEVKMIKQTLPKPRSGFSGLALENKLIIVGGNDGHVLNTVDALVLDTMTWEKLPPMITKRDELAVTLGPDGKIYAVGGYGGSDK